jgi:hypothetical protein
MFTAPTGIAETTALPIAGAVWFVTVASSQALVTRHTSNDPTHPGQLHFETHSFSVALATSAAVVPAGSVERSNCSSARLWDLTASAAAAP